MTGTEDSNRHADILHSTSNTSLSSPTNLQENTDDDPVPEGGWGWMIVISISIMLTVLFGFIFALAVFFVEWMRHFDATATEISWVVSIAPVIAGLTSPVAGVLCTKFGSRNVAVCGSTITFAGVILSSFAQSVIHLYITIGVMTGIGGGLVFTPTLVMLSHYFEKRYVLANSIAFSGYSFAQMIIPRLVQFLIEEYGWRGALLIMSAVLAHLFVCAALLKPRVSHKSPTRIKQVAGQDNCAYETELNSKTKSVWTSSTSIHMYDDVRNPPLSTTYQERRNIKNIKSQLKDSNRRRSSIAKCSFYLKVTFGLSALSKSALYGVTLVGSFAAGVGWFVTNSHLVARAVTGGVSQNNAAFLITVIGIGSFVGRSGHGFIIDKGLINREPMFIAAMAVTGFLSLVNPFMKTFELLCVFAVLFGVSHGIANSLYFAIIRLQFASSAAAAALSCGTLVIAVSNATGGVLAGVLFDKTGNYDMSFYFAGGMILSGTLLLFLAFLFSHIKQRTCDKSQEPRVSATNM